MYQVKVSVKESRIDGEGVFADQEIELGQIVWIFDKQHDKIMTQVESKQLSTEERQQLERIGYLSPWSGLWVYPPDGDPAQYTNHSDANNLSAKFDESVSNEPYFIANRHIRLGEEITNNYHQFDRITQSTNPNWSES
jgi:SET domain-containing protein